MSNSAIKKHRRERGVVLLFALGILSLLLVIAMAFASNSVMARKAAGNSLGRVQSQYFANLAVSRIMSAIRYMDYHQYQEQVPYLTSRNNVKVYSTADSDRIGKNEQLLDAYLNYRRYQPKDALPDKLMPQWEYVFDKYNQATGLPASGAKIIGRYAYWAIPRNGTLNLSEVLRGNTALSNSSNSKWDTRYGKSVRELPLNASNPLSSAAISALSEKFASAESVKEDDDQYKQYDYENLAFDTIDTTKLTQDHRRWLYEWFAPGGYNDLEAATSDPTGQGHFNRRSSFRKFHRFNLTNETWNNGLGTGSTDNANKEEAVVKLLGRDLPFIQAGTPELLDNGLEIKYFDIDKGQVADTAIVLPFLNGITDNAGAYPGAEIRRKQIAANLLDYCDSDNIPTSDCVNSNWWSNCGALNTTPNYTGNERTPYLNEVAFRLFVNVRRNDELVNNPDPPGGQTRHSDLTLSASVDEIKFELFDIYKDSLRSGLKTRISGKIIMDVDMNGTVTERELVIGGDTDYSFSSSSDRYICHNENPAWSIGDVNSESLLNADTVPCRVKIKNIVIDKWILSAVDGSDINIDLTRNLEFDLSPDGDTKVLTIDVPKVDIAAGQDSGFSDTPSAFAFDISVDDPRDNLYKGASGTDYENWKLTYDKVADPATVPADYNTGDVKGSIGGKNDNCKPTETGDREDFRTASLTAGATGDRAGVLSTAFIRNNAMVSPMELGAIHRGAKWQTINLKAANGNAGPHHYKQDEGISGGGSADRYADGDGAILNHVKMTKDVYSAGKINLNQKNTAQNQTDFFAMLFNGVGVNGASYDVERQAGTSISYSAARSIAGKLIDKRGTDPQLLARAEILTFGSGSDDSLSDGYGVISGLTTDAEKEALAGKILTLTTTLTPVTNDLQFVIVAQSIRDVDSDGIEITKIADDGSDTEKKHTPQFGKFDYVKYTKDGKDKYVYFDEITGEAKVLVTINYDRSTKKIQLRSFEYLQ